MNYPPLMIDRRFSTAQAIVCLLWFAACAAGVVWLVAYENVPASAVGGRAVESGERLPRWPVESAIPFGGEGSTLVMFVHPQCPCTRASLAELEKIVARASRSADASSAQPLHLRIVTFAPTQPVAHWSRSDLLAQAAAIPGAIVHRDDDGREAALFGAAASGHAMLFDARGKLLFSGGVTIARGHEGDNPGASALVDLLAGGSGNCGAAAVFGCPIVTRESSKP